MKKQIIKDLALAAGFKLKPQPDGAEDLNPYVYDFAKMLGAHVALSGYADIVKAECLRLQAGDVVAISLKAEFFEHTEFHEFYKKGLTSLMPAGVHCVIMAEGCTLSELPDDELALAGLQRVGASSAMDALAAQVEELQLCLKERKAVCHQAFDANDALKAERDALAAQFVALKQSVISARARGNLLHNITMQMLQGAELNGSDWDYISESQVAEIEKHLAEIRADAAIKGWWACWEWVDSDDRDKLTLIPAADQYADSIRQEGK